VPLPNSAKAQETLRKAEIERPVHNSGHPEENDFVEERLEYIRERIRRSSSGRTQDEIDKEIKENSKDWSESRKID
jgi:hypothetical protein